MIIISTHQNLMAHVPRGHNDFLCAFITLAIIYNNYSLYYSNGLSHVHILPHNSASISVIGMCLKQTFSLELEFYSV